MATSNNKPGSTLIGLLVAASVGWYVWRHYKPSPRPPSPLTEIAQKFHPTTLPALNAFNLQPVAALPAYAPNENLPADAVVVRSQPAIFRALMMGQSHVTTPKSVQLNMLALTVEYFTQKYAHLIAAAEPQADAMWRIVSSHPAAYLSASTESVTTTIDLGTYGSGTAFAVSRQGIFLTNAHLLGDPPDAPLMQRTLGEVVSLLGPALKPWIAGLVGQIGPCTNQQAALPPLVAWYAQHSSATSRFDHLELVLGYETSLAPDARSFLTLINDPPHPLTRRCRVLAHGEPIPGKDVAVLQLQMEPVSLTRSPDAADRFVCLPLGDSDDALAGSTVEAMGFPGSGFSQAVMDASAAFRVSAVNGQISTTKQMRGGWDAFEMTAEINHGDSGGPVLNSRGQVIALNVGAARPDDPRGHTLAVPINLAKQFLASANIHPDPGPLTQKWVEGIRSYFAGHNADAATAFKIVREMERAEELQPGAVAPLSATNERAVDNPYVSALLDRAQQKADSR